MRILRGKGSISHGNSKICRNVFEKVGLGPIPNILWQHFVFQELIPGIITDIRSMNAIGHIILYNMSKHIFPLKLYDTSMQAYKFVSARLPLYRLTK